MEISNNNKKENEFSTIFSNIADPEKTHVFSDLQNNLSKLQQSVSSLRFYGTKGKINSKKIRKKIFASPIFQTEQNQNIKTSKKKLTQKYYKDYNRSINKNSTLKIKTKDINNTINTIYTINNDDNNDTYIKNNTINQMTKTTFNKGSESNIFITKVKYKKNKDHNTLNTFHNINTLNNTNYNTNPNINIFPKNNQSKLPQLKPIDFTKLSSSKKDDNNSFNKIKFEKKNNTSRNKPVINNKNKTISLDKTQFPQVTNIMIKKMKKENNNIKNNIYKGIEKFNVMEWYMKTRFKYALYKYGIAEIQKYFMDIKAYGKPEEEEIEKRKTFYEHVEDIIDDIHAIKQQKELEKLNKKYGVKYDKKKLNKLNKKNEKEDDNKFVVQKKQMVELSKALQEIDKRQKKEKKKRQEIDDILFKCKQGIQSINSMDRKLPKNERKNIIFD